METPRLSTAAHPEIQFAGSLAAPAARTPSDPAVAAAFIAFHRNTAGMVQLGMRKRYMSRGAVALSALALLGFGGGLFLAFFSFNSPEGSGRTVAARPSEFIYTAGVVSDDSETASTAPSYGPIHDSTISAPVFALAARDESTSETSLWRDAHGANLGFSAQPYGSDGMRAFAAIGPVSAGAPRTSLESVGITSGFDAFTAAPIPEPSTWATMLTGLGLLILVGRGKRRGP